MKSIFFTRLSIAIIIFLGVTMTATAQGKKKSPPATATHTVGDLSITVDYHSPSVRGREVWGKLVPHGKVWRTGANEATTFEVNKDVLINGEKLVAGKYALFTIPDKEEWVFIFNKEPNQWGAYRYDSSKDVLRITAKTSKASEFAESMTFIVGDNDENIGIVGFVWENLKTGFQVAPAE